jgi:hypothetical protein
MARFGEINAQYFDDAGNPLGSGKLYFYDTGTTTLKNTYSDINFTIPNPNPVILTAAGRQPNIFFDGVAKAILADKNDVQILVRDPVGETGTNFGDPWVATKIYSTNAVVIGTDGVYYRSLSAGNQNNNPTTTSGFWSLLYSVQWNAGISYQEGSVVTYDGEQFQSLTNSNVNNNPSISAANWVLLSFAWISTAEYALNQNAVGTDGVLYTSQQAANTGNDPTDPANRPTYWVGTSADAATSAAAAAVSAAAALVSENAAELAETNAETAQTAAEAAQAAAETAETNAETAETNSAASAAASATSAGEAATSETNAAISAADAAATYDQFDDRYLGVKSSDPTLDNDGNALLTGALYFNTTLNTMKVYSGSAWGDIAPVATSITASQISDYTGTAAELNYNDITTLGLTEASKTVTADANGVVTFDNGISEEYNAVTSTSNATTCNMQDGTNFSHVLTENTTFTFSNPAASGKVSAFTLKIVQDASASGFTVTWPAAVDWAAATAPTLTATASAVDYFVFITHDGGTTWYGFTAGQAMG